MKTNSHDAKLPNGFSHIVSQRETDATEGYDLIKYQCLVAVGKPDQGLWRPRFKCPSL